MAKEVIKGQRMLINIEMIMFIIVFSMFLLFAGSKLYLNYTGSAVVELEDVAQVTDNMLLTRGNYDFIVMALPTVDTIKLNATSPGNYTTDNLTLNYTLHSRCN